jgi:hypothetical protein
MKTAMASALVLLLTITVPANSLASAAQRDAEKEAERVEELREKASKLGVGRNVKLRLTGSRTDTKGTLTAFDQKGWTLTEKDTARQVTGTWTELQSIKKDGTSGLKMVLFGAAIGAGIFLLHGFLTYCSNEGGC